MPVLTDSTIPPPLPQNQQFSLKNVSSWLLETRKDAMKKLPSPFSLIAKDCEGLTKYDVRVTRVTVFREKKLSPPFSLIAKDCKGLTKYDVRVTSVNVFREIQPRVRGGFLTSDFVDENEGTTYRRTTLLMRLKM